MANKISPLTQVWLQASACCCSPSEYLYLGRETPHTAIVGVLAKNKDKMQEQNKKKKKKSQE